MMSKSVPKNVSRAGANTHPKEVVKFWGNVYRLKHPEQVANLVAALVCLGTAGWALFDLITTGWMPFVASIVLCAVAGAWNLVVFCSRNFVRMPVSKFRRDA